MQTLLGVATLLAKHSGVCKMSKMNDISMEVNEMLEAGYLPVTVASMLEIPINWIYETAEANEELSPFETVNS